MTRKKHRYQNSQPKQQAPQPEAPKPAEPQAEGITRYKAVVRSPLGEWWHDNKKRVRLFSIIGGVVLVVGWLLVELFMLIF